MLSYDSPVSMKTMKTQNPTSPATMSNGHQNIPPSPKVVRLPTPALSNGVQTNGAVSINGPKPEKERHIWLVTGPAGCGKSTVAKYLATVLNLPYIEGDEVCFKGSHCFA